MIKEFLDDIIKNQQDSKYNDCRYNGRLNVAECLENLGLQHESGSYAYVVLHYTFPNADYSQLDMYDFAFSYCDYSAANFKGIKFDGCWFDRAPYDMSNTHLLNMRIDANAFLGAQCIGARFTNCTSAGLYNINFTNAVIESDGKLLGEFFSGKVDFDDCIFNGATIKKQLIRGNIHGSWIQGATFVDSVLLNAKIFGDITNMHFNNVTVVPPNGNPSFIWAETHSILDLSNFKNNTITNCNWNYLQLFGVKPTEDLPLHFNGNSFINNTFACAQLTVDQTSYEGKELKNFINSKSNGALVRNNDYAPQRWGGLSCVDRSRSSGPIKFGIICMWIVIPIIALLIIGYFSKRMHSRYIIPRIEARRQRQLLSDFKALVDECYYLQRSLENYKNYQSGMMKILRNTVYQNNGGEYADFPLEVYDMLLNYFPLINLDNPNHNYHTELSEHRNFLSQTLFKPPISDTEDDIRIDFGAEDDIPLMEGVKSQFNDSGI